MPGKVLVVILAGKNDADRARQGLQFAKNVRRLNALSEVKVLFFGPGVELLNPDNDLYSGVRSTLTELESMKVGVSACVANIRRYGLDEKLEKGLVVAEEAAHLISDHVKNGYQLLSF